MANTKEENPFAVEHGRIRLGRKGGRGGREALSTFRFTSPDEAAITSLAAVYGGTPKKWEDPKASPMRQWEVITTSDTIKVWLPPGALTIQFERWSGGGMLSYCDGEQVVVFKGEEEEHKPCVCVAKGERVCQIKIRLQCLFPDLESFEGTWRLQSGSESAAREMPAIERMLQQLQATGIVPATIRLEERQTQGGKHKFVVPKLSIDMGLSQMLESTSTHQIEMPGQVELEEGPDAEVIELRRDEDDS